MDIKHKRTARELEREFAHDVTLFFPRKINNLESF